MKFLVTALLFFIPVFLFSQSLVNYPTQRDRDFEIFSDSLEHTNIFPYNLNIQEDSTRMLNVNFSPVLYLSQAFDLSNKNFISNYQFGATVYTNYRNKLYLNISGYYGFLKPESFFSESIDLLRIIPNVGTVIHQYKNSFTYGGFVGEISYQPKSYINFQIGNGKTFLGDGYRSLLLSDNSSPYPFFKATVDVGHIKYLYMIAKQKDFDFRYSQNYSDLFPKYTFTHYLSFNFLKRINISMFETVVTSPYDSLGAHRGLEFNYLNPVIFFRSVETQQGSPDNVLVGFSGHVKIFKTGMVYGQIFIDEFILSHIKSSTEYWDEKYGFQAGMKFYNTFNIKRLYTQFELNAARPYTYSHNNPIRAYTNNLQPLAHPLGANFAEAVAIVSYTFDNFYTQAKFVYSRFGDNDSLNYGKNPNLSYGTRIDDDGILWFQGITSTLEYAQFTFGYQKWKFLLSFDLIYRNLQTSNNITNNLIFQFSIGKPLFNRYLDWK